MLRITLQISQALFFAVCLSIALYAMAKPDRPIEPKELPIPQLAAQTNWGYLSQDGRKLKLRGGAHWEADGEIRKDGKIFLLWILLSDGRAAPGLYELDGKDGLNGRWNYGTACEQDDKGNWMGLDMHDRIYKVMLPVD